MDSVLKQIFISVGLGILAIFVSLAFYVYKTGARSLSSMNSRMAVILGSNNEPSFTKYKGQYVDGKTVISILEKFGGDYFFRIKTKRDPVSFVVADKPKKGFFTISLSDHRKYADYTDSSSLYYLNENAQFMTYVLRSSGGDVLGALFTEKGSGALTGYVKAAYLSAGTGTLDNAKNVYATGIDNETNSFNDTAYRALLDTVQTDINNANNQANDYRAESFTGGTPSIGSSEYNNAKNQAKAANERVNAAWHRLESQFTSETGKAVDGHASISSDVEGLEDNTSNLYYWNRLFSSGGDS